MSDRLAEIKRRHQTNLVPNPWPDTWWLIAEVDRLREEVEQHKEAIELGVRMWERSHIKCEALTAENARLRDALRNLCVASGWFGDEVHKRLGDEFMPYNAAVAFRASRDDALKLLESSDAVLAPKAVEP